MLRTYKQDKFFLFKSVLVRQAWFDINRSHCLQITQTSTIINYRAKKKSNGKQEWISPRKELQTSVKKYSLTWCFTYAHADLFTNFFSGSFADKIKGDYRMPPLTIQHNKLPSCSVDNMHQLWDNLFLLVDALPFMNPDEVRTFKRHPFTKHHTDSSPWERRSACNKAHN